MTFASAPDRFAADTVHDGHDGVIVGASIHLDRHDGRVVEFLRKNRDTLQRLPSAFFPVSLAAHGDTEHAEGYVEQLEQDTAWRPAKVGLFGGALPYTRYGFVRRHLMKRIAEDKPGHLGTDTSRHYVYTEWDGVTRFIEDFLTYLGKRHRRAGGAAVTPTTPIRR
jgi:menaquinone-dependent protoporphyrinogen oxidase